MNTKIVKMIYNPVAGQRHHRRFSKIVKLLKANFKKLEILETNGKGHAIALAQGLEKNIDLFKFNGGDMETYGQLPKWFIVVEYLVKIIL